MPLLAYYDVNTRLVICQVFSLLYLIILLYPLRLWYQIRSANLLGKRNPVFVRWPWLGRTSFTMSTVRGLCRHPFREHALETPFQ